MSIHQRIKYYFNKPRTYLEERQLGDRIAITFLVLVFLLGMIWTVL